MLQNVQKHNSLLKDIIAYWWIYDIADITFWRHIFRSNKAIQNVPLWIR